MFETDEAKTQREPSLVAHHYRTKNLTVGFKHHFEVFIGEVRPWELFYEQIVENSPALDPLVPLEVPLHIEYAVLTKLLPIKLDN
jgi:hypothetical protein